MYHVDNKQINCKNNELYPTLNIGSIFAIATLTTYEFDDSFCSILCAKLRAVIKHAR